MATVRALRMTEPEYLEYDLAHEGKHEFYNGDVVAMAGVSEAHDTMTVNLLTTLYARLRGGPCRVHTSDLRVRVADTGAYVYPDLTVVCGPKEFAPTRPESLTNPTLVVEVLSESTEAHDRGAKAAHYRRLPSLRAYLMVATDRRHLELHVRDGDAWRIVEATDGELTIAAIDVRVGVEEVYAGVELGG